jgi:hypothetical protein
MPEERRGRVARNAARPMIEAIVKVCVCGVVEWRERECQLRVWSDFRGEDDELTDERAWVSAPLMA